VQGAELSAAPDESVPQPESDFVPDWSGRCQLLSLDGGGIRGLFSAAILAKLEEDTKTEITRHFDLVAGTSTGGIIAIGLGLGLSPRQIVEFYVEHGPRIFRNPLGLRGLLRPLWPKFGPAALREALRSTFGERPLGASRKRLVVPSYNLGEHDVYIFKTAHHPRLRRDYRLPAWQAAMATSAAPTYFPAFGGIDGQRLVDGAVWANNPTMVAVVEAASMLGARLDDIRVFSIGTTTAVSKTPRGLDTAGLVAWARPVSDLFLRGQSLAAHKQARHLLGGERVLRIDPPVAEGELALGAASSPARAPRAGSPRSTGGPTGSRRSWCGRAVSLLGAVAST